MRRLFCAVTLVAALVLGVTVQPAGAGYWRWPAGTGYGYFYSQIVVGSCWYHPGAVCSGWNYWCDSYTEKQDGGQILHAFENSDRIRGHYVSGGGADLLLTTNVSMGGYLKASDTYWGNPASHLMVDVDNEYQVC